MHAGFICDEQVAMACDSNFSICIEPVKWTNNETMTTLCHSSLSLLQIEYDDDSAICYAIPSSSQLPLQTITRKEFTHDGHRISTMSGYDNYKVMMVVEVLSSRLRRKWPIYDDISTAPPIAIPAFVRITTASTAPKAEAETADFLQTH